MEFVKNLFNLYILRFEFFKKLFIEHIMLSLTAIFFVSIIGIGLGIIITRTKKISSYVLMISNFLYTIPSIALFGILVTITGIGKTSAIIALTMYGVLPVIRNTYVGIMEVEKDIVEAAIGMGSTDLELLFRIQIPMALPVIIAGFRTMVVMTIALGGIASFIGAGGLGVAIWRGITTNYTEMTIAGSLLVASLAIFADIILGFIEKRLRIKILGKAK